MTKNTVLGQHPPVARAVDISDSIVAKDYPGTFIKVLDNVFTLEECAALIAHAEASKEWCTAMIQTGRGERIDEDVRNNDRILLFDHDLANEITQRLLPHVQEINEIAPGSKWERIVGLPGFVTETWKLLGVNERLSFLRYGPGHYFKPHYDGLLQLPDGRRSYVTVQIYLNDDDLSGGATRMFGKAGEDGKDFFDVEPKAGRVLIFEQKPFVHSGEEVVRGFKYTMRSDFLFKSVRWPRFAKLFN